MIEMDGRFSPSSVFGKRMGRHRCWVFPQLRRLYRISFQPIPDSSLFLWVPLESTAIGLCDLLSQKLVFKS